MGRSNREARDKAHWADLTAPDDMASGQGAYVDTDQPRNPNPPGGVHVGHPAPPPESDGEGPDGGVTIDGHQWR